MFKSSTLTRIRCEYAVVRCGRCGCSHVEPGKFPVNGLTQAREPMPVWLPFKPEPYASEQPEPRCVAVRIPLLHPKPQTVSCRCRSKRVLTPRTGRFVRSARCYRAATHSVKILRNKRMIVVWQREPIHVGSSHCYKHQFLKRGRRVPLTAPLSDCDQAQAAPQR